MARGSGRKGVRRGSEEAETAAPRHPPKSKSQRKREFKERKALSVELGRLSAEQLAAIPLSDDTREAILASQGMSRAAWARQHGHIASLLEREDLDAVRAAHAGELQPHVEEVESFHEVERWRDRLMSGDNEPLTEFVEAFPQCDPTRLRQLIRNARKESELGKPPRAARELFRTVRELVEVDG